MKTGKLIRNIVAVVLFSFLIIAFAVTGITNDVLRPVAKDAVVTAGSFEVAGAEFKAIFDQQREQAAQKAGRPVTVDEAVESGMDQGILRELVDRNISYELFDRLGIRPSAKVVADALREIPNFFDQVTGRFDSNAYQTALAKQGMNPARFEKVLAGEIAGSHFAAAMQGGFKPPLSLVAMQGAIILESRDASFIYITPAMAGEPPAPTDAQLQTFMAENAAQIRLPERRELTFLRLSASKVRETVKADPAEVQKIVDFRKDQGATPETRSLIQIPAKDKATAEGISQRLAKGEDPAAIAKSAGVSVVTYDNKPKTALPDRKIADAAFSLAQGQVSGPIQGDLGFAVVKVLGVTAGQAGSTDSLRGQVEQELLAREAEAKVTEIADKLEAAIASGADLETAAKTAGVEVVKTPAMTREGRTQGGQPTPGLSLKLVETAFGLAEGSTSEFETEQAGEYFMVRADKVLPPTMPPFAEIRDMLDKSWRLREVDRRLTAKGNEASARLRKGESIDVVAKDLGAQVSRLENLSQNSAREAIGMYGESLVDVIFGLKKGDVSVARAPQPGIVVVKVDNLKAGDPNLIARGVVQARGQFSQLLAQEGFEAVALYARQIVKAKSYPDRARSVIGAQALDKAKADAKAEEKKG